MIQQGITFFKEYFDFMDDMSCEQFCEFMSLIRDLRFYGHDTKPEEVEDRDVRLAWRSIRPAVLKSISNARAYNKKKAGENKNEEESTQPIPTCDLTSEEKMGLKNIETEAKTTQPPMNVIPKVGMKDERLQEWVLGMKDNPDDGKLFSKWIWFFKNRDEAVYWLSTH